MTFTVTEHMPISSWKNIKVGTVDKVLPGLP